MNATCYHIAGVKLHIVRLTTASFGSAPICPSVSQSVNQPARERLIMKRLRYEANISNKSDQSKGSLKDKVVCPENPRLMSRVYGLSNLGIYGRMVLSLAFRFGALQGLAEELPDVKTLNPKP